jgi:hypothetical protein
MKTSNLKLVAYFSLINQPERKKERKKERKMCSYNIASVHLPPNEAVDWLALLRFLAVTASNLRWTTIFTSVPLGKCSNDTLQNFMIVSCYIISKSFLPSGSTQRKY